MDTSITTPTPREHLFQAYLTNMTEYMQMEFPQADRAALKTFIKSEVAARSTEMIERLNIAKANNEDLTLSRSADQRLWPTLRMVRNVNPEAPKRGHSYGNITYYDNEDLLGVTLQNRDKIVSPFGTFYETVDKKPSFLKGMVDVKGKKRKTEKKAMLQAKKEGNKTKETFHNNNQATIKINMNSLIGGMGSGFNFLSSIANFNSVTSIARFFIINAYAHAERFLESNFYFRTEEQLINFLITVHRKGPDPLSVVNLCNKAGIRIPELDEVYTFLTNCLHRYMFPQDHPSVRKILAGLHIGELAFIFYMSNMKHLVMENSEFFRDFTSRFFGASVPSTTPNVEPDALYKLDGDLAVVLSTVYHDIIPLNEKGNSISIYDTIEQYPILAKQLVYLGQHMQSVLDEIQEIFELFMNHKVGIGYVAEHKQMFRDTVILSDTDSIVFTTKSWAEWFNGSLKLDQAAFNMNALVVYWLSKANGYILYNVSHAFRALGKDLVTMNMKNEFMMPIEILTSLKKHYIAMLKIQEGVVYSKPRLDIKGVNLRGSNFSHGTLKYVVWFIQGIIDDIYTTGKVSAKKKITEVLRFERFVLDSLRAGETSFLTVDPVKAEEEYTDADRTIFFNYLFWEQVFAEKYGSIMIPTKCYVLPLTNIQHPKYLEFLKTKFPEAEQKLQAFVSKNITKDINRIPINPLVDEIPEELRMVADYKAVVYANTRPLYLTMASLGITLGNSKKLNSLYSDVYGWISADEGNLVRSITEIKNDK